MFVILKRYIWKSEKKTILDAKISKGQILEYLVVIKEEFQVPVIK